MAEQSEIAGQSGEKRTEAVKVYLSDEAIGMLAQLMDRRFPGRPRVQSQTVEMLIREEHAREFGKGQRG